DAAGESYSHINSREAVSASNLRGHRRSYRIAPSDLPTTIAPPAVGRARSRPRATVVLAGRDPHETVPSRDRDRHTAASEVREPAPLARLPGPERVLEVRAPAVARPLDRHTA